MKYRDIGNIGESFIVVLTEKKNREKLFVHYLTFRFFYFQIWSVHIEVLFNSSLNIFAKLAIHVISFILHSFINRREERPYNAYIHSASCIIYELKSILKMFKSLKVNFMNNSKKLQC